MMVTVYDVEPGRLIQRAAERLEKEGIIEMPEWALYVKMGHGSERLPVQRNWYFVRAASILRKFYLKRNLGIGKLRGKYSKRKNLGVSPSHRVKAGGKILRSIAQQFEKKGFLKKAETKGREITAEGRKFLDRVSREIISEEKVRPDVERKEKPTK